MPDCRLDQRERAVRMRLLGQRNQTSRVTARILRSGKHHVVTRHLALNRKTTVDPPHCGVKEEQGTNYFLSQVCPVVPTLQVRCLVQYDCVQFFGREFAQRPTRKSDHRME